MPDFHCAQCRGGPLRSCLRITASTEADFWMYVAEQVFCSSVCLWNWVTTHRRALEEMDRARRQPAMFKDGF